MTRTSIQKSTRRAGSAGKIAITLRLDPDRVQQLQTIAEAENRTLTNLVETTLIRDLVRRDEAARVITMRAAPGTSNHVAPEDIVRGHDESDEAFARRRNLLTELWSIPDSD
ncbi:hypothetical protein [Rhodopila globiformis]|jgi:hypothetical protein|uniref:Uncharacterized protein n=1 Tax=Rhodopila globiformis TaxID=1071 RepID=A0A2S6NEL4_RHOGL|nr:hypothetical protein [Rhodopila globiformis]PPQ33040.1 hypothetical protein CCS01_15115 [Rhodopila globiformis]